MLETEWLQAGAAPGGSRPVQAWSDGGWELEAAGLLYRRRRDADHVLIRLSGEIDIATAPPLRRLLSDAASGAAAVHLDLAAVTFFDAAGVRCLLEAHDELSARGGRLIIRRVHRQVRRVLELTGLTQRLGIPDAAADGA